MGVLLQDVRFGLRMMAKTPVVTAVAILSLALGIAANAGTFSVVNGFLIEPLPYEDQQSLVIFRSLRQGESIEMGGGVSVPNFRDYLEASSAVSEGVAYTIERANLTGLDTPEQLNLVVATPSLFDVLGVPPMIGRGFTPDEGAEGAGNVLVLHHDYWQRRFLGDRGVLGRVVTVDGLPYTVVGVMPDGFDMVPANVHAFRPSDFAAQLDERGSTGYLALGRLREGATVEQVAFEVEPVHRSIVAQFPDEMRAMEVVVQPLREFFPGPTDAQLLKIISAVTLFGLLIACANIANLLLARAEERQREVAVRTAMGAGRGRILTQLLTESTLLGVVGGGLGIWMSVWLVGWIRTAMPAEMPKAMMPELDPEVVGVTFALALLAGIAFGLAPAVLSSRANLREALGNGARGGTAGRSRKRVRNLFVVAEVAAALALLSGAGFLVQAFEELAGQDPGFDAAGLMTFEITVLEDRYVDDSEVVAYQRELLRVLDALPEVESVAMMSSLPRGPLQSAYDVHDRRPTRARADGASDGGYPVGEPHVLPHLGGRAAPGPPPGRRRPGGCRSRRGRQRGVGRA